MCHGGYFGVGEDLDQTWIISEGKVKYSNNVLDIYSHSYQFAFLGSHVSIKGAVWRRPDLIWPKLYCYTGMEIEWKRKENNGKQWNGMEYTT